MQVKGVAVHSRAKVRSVNHIKVNERFPEEKNGEVPDSDHQNRRKAEGGDFLHIAGKGKLRTENKASEEMSLWRITS